MVYFCAVTPPHVCSADTSSQSALLGNVWCISRCRFVNCALYQDITIHKPGWSLHAPGTGERGWLWIPVLTCLVLQGDQGRRDNDHYQAQDPAGG